MVIESLMLNYWLGEALGWWPADYGREMLGAVRMVLLGLGLLGGCLWLLFNDIGEIWREGFWIEPVVSKQADGEVGAAGVIKR